MATAAGIANAVTERRFDQARDAAIALWHATPDPRLGDLCLRLAELRLEKPDGKKAWKRETRTPGTVDLDVLACTLLPVHRSGVLTDRARLLERRGPDPRVGAALERALRTMPFTSNSARGNLGELFEVVARVARQDPRFARILDTLHDDWNVREAQRDWLFRRFAKVAELIDARWPESPRLADDGALDALLTQLADNEEPAGREVDLLADVYARPWDSGARSVLRDALLEVGDPRGTWMALAADGGDPERRQALFDAHHEEWLGAIAPFVTVTEWTDGFPSAGVVRFEQPRDVDAHGTNPAWRTIQDLTLSGWKVGPMLHPFLAHVCDAVTTLRSASNASAALLLQHDWPRLERLEIGAAPRTALDGLGKMPLPALRHLVTGTSDTAWLDEAIWLGQLETLVLDSDQVHKLVERIPTVIELDGLETFAAHNARLERGVDGRLSVLRLMRGPNRDGRPPRPVPDHLAKTALVRIPDAALTAIVLEPDAPEVWLAPVQELIARSTRLQRAVLPTEQQHFDHALDWPTEGLARPLPALRWPTTMSAGPAGVWVAQDEQLLRIDPETNDVIEVVDTGRVGTVTVGEHVVCAAFTSVFQLGGWRNEGPARSVSLGADRVLVVGDGALRVVDANGETVSHITSGTKNVLGAVFSPDGTQIAAIGTTRLRVYPAGGGRARMPHPANLTHAVAWTVAGIWLFSQERGFELLDEDGTAKRSFDLRPRWLRAFGSGVLLREGSEIVVLDENGDEQARFPGIRAWPVPGGLVVLQREAPWLRLHRL
jgi:hypothetical protein